MSEPSAVVEAMRVDATLVVDAIDDMTGTFVEENKEVIQPTVAEVLDVLCARALSCSHGNWVLWGALLEVLVQRAAVHQGPVRDTVCDAIMAQAVAMVTMIQTGDFGGIGDREGQAPTQEEVH